MEHIKKPIYAPDKKSKTKLSSDFNRFILNIDDDGVTK